MAKRKTKCERIEGEKAALRQRVTDMLSGANGGVVEIDEGCVYADTLSRWLCAIRETLLTQEQRDEHPGLMIPACLGNFETPEKAADFLYRRGVRA